MKNQVIERKNNKPILLDTFFNKNNQPKPIIIFCHGYKGFKDWGAWNLMAEAFSKANFFFIKFSFSHNGGTIEQPIDFPDLEAFGQNNFSKELDDLKTIIDWICNNTAFKNEIDTNNISLIGHSRGGGIVTIKAAEDTRIKKVITLAGVSDYKARFPKNEALATWRKKGVSFIKNARTQQEMPHYFQFFEDFEANEKRFTIKRAVSNLKIPHLIIHGTNDTTVTLKEGEVQHQWNNKSTLKIIKNADHAFGASHPWNEKNTPKDLQKAINFCLDFLT